MAGDMGARLLTIRSEYWKLGHLEYADDLCLLANSKPVAEMLLEHLDVMLKKFNMEMAAGKTKFVCVNMENTLTELRFGSKHSDILTPR